MEDDRVLVGLRDARNQVPAVAPHLIVRRVVDGAHRPHDVIRVERRTVRPLHCAPQVPRDRATVTADSAVLLRRDDRREFWNRAVVGPYRTRYAIVSCERVFSVTAVARCGFSVSKSWVSPMRRTCAIVDAFWRPLAPERAVAPHASTIAASANARRCFTGTALGSDIHVHEVVELRELIRLEPLEVAVVRVDVLARRRAPRSAHPSRSLPGRCPRTSAASPRRTRL